MPKYCLGQTAPNGRREYLAVEAETPGDAVRLQRSLGFRDSVQLRFHLTNAKLYSFAFR